MSEAKRTVIVTGANGFLGMFCCQAFRSKGFDVLGFVRDPGMAAKSLQGVRLFKYQLSDQIDRSAFSGNIDAVIHCANDPVLKTNVEGTGRLLDLSQQSGVRQFIFISSLAAHPEARSSYGRSKYEIEKRVAAQNQVIVKPGTIVGPGGLFQRTREMVRRSLVLPVFYGGQRRLQIIWIEDLCKFIVKIVEEQLKGTFVLAEEKGVKIRDFYRLIAILEGKKRDMTVPFPGDVALMLVWMMEGIGVKLPISSDNLLGLRHLKSFSSEGIETRLGLKIAPFVESLKCLAEREGNSSVLNQLDSYVLS